MKITISNSSFCDAVRAHAEAYPLMKPRDAVKLAFQAAFGPAHMIDDPSAAIEHMKKEAAKAPSHSFFGNGCCDIGGGFSRVFLHSKMDRETLDLIGKMFVMTAAESAAKSAAKSAATRCTNDIKDAIFPFYEELFSAAERGMFSFTRDELAAEIAAHEAAGFPAVSHSEEFRAAYSPSYRVVKSEYAQLMPLMIEIWRARERAKKSGKTAIFALDGRCASGKTTLSAEISALFDCPIISMDDFFLPPDKRTEERLLEVGGNVDYERFRAEVLDAPSGNGIEYSVFDCSKMKIAGIKRVPPCPLWLIEGSYSHHPYFKDHGGREVIRAFMTVDPQRQRERIIRRNGEKIWENFHHRWIPMEEAYFSAFGIESCDFILTT